MTTETNVSERVKRAEKHLNEQLSYGGIFPSTGPFGNTLEYRYQDGDLVDEICQMRRLADALSSLADALEPEAKGTPEAQGESLYPVHLEGVQLQIVKELLEQASSRVADPDSPLFLILDEVRAARRRNPMIRLSASADTNV
ncbi:hypothetical protein [Pseudomonas monteilii]|uniref:hypothetical protein n=1 Tax=Pseudomonas monteilii TaxID=76759 RepID=UPI0015FE5F11|nr:hypothetical protein [Pseudomonas monteilii]MBA6105265.1 hypothetical protein [Pseudomonas monteilii]